MLLGLELAGTGIPSFEIELRGVAGASACRSPDQQWMKLGSGCCAVRSVGRLWSNMVGRLGGGEMGKRTRSHS